MADMVRIKELIEGVMKGTDNPNAVRNKQGRIYCKVCGEQLERYDSKYSCYFPRACSCIVNERKKKEARVKQMQLDLARSKCFGGRDKSRLKEARFENDKGYNPDQMRKAKGFANGFKKILYGLDGFDKGQGLLFWGTVGTGKSYIAACIANDVLEQGYEVRYLSFVDIATRLQNNFGQTEAILEEIRRPALVIFDDLGAERQSEWMQEKVLQVINIRMESMKPMILTTNLTLTEMSDTQDQQKKRIYDRLWECCDPIELNGDSRRRAALKERRKKNLQMYEELADG